MALLSLIFGGPKKAIIGAMELDASVSEIHERSAMVTRSEIEDANTVSDHVALEPLRLTVEGLISDAPISLFSSLIGTTVGAGGQLVNDAGGGFLAGTAAAVGLGVAAGSLAKLIQKSPRTPEEAFRYLEELYQFREPMTVVTAIKQYENMVMEKLTIPRDAKVGKSLRFTAVFTQVRIVQSQTTQVPRFAQATNTNNTVTEGKKPAEILGDDTPRASILKRGLDTIVRPFQ